MKRLLEQSRYLLLGIVGTSFVAFLAVVGWGFYKTINTLWAILNGVSKGDAVTVSFIQLMDTYLIATVFYIFTVAIYELFIGDLDLPAWLVIHNLDELKSKLTSLIVLVIAITFLEHFIGWQDAQTI